MSKADCFIEFIRGAWLQYTLCIGVRKRTTLAAMQLDDDTFNCSQCLQRCLAACRRPRVYTGYPTRGKAGHVESYVLLLLYGYVVA